MEYDNEREKIDLAVSGPHSAGGLEALCHGHEMFIGLETTKGIVPYDLVSGLNPTAAQIQDFCKIIGAEHGIEDFTRDTANYITALVESSIDDDFFFQFPEGVVLDNIGYGLKSKKMTVDGPAGDYVGSNMEGGTIVVQGSVGMSLGYKMRGGTIIVNESAGPNVGFYMTGGDIHVGECAYPRPLLLADVKLWGEIWCGYRRVWKKDFDEEFKEIMKTKPKEIGETVDKSEAREPTV